MSATKVEPGSGVRFAFLTPRKLPSADTLTGRVVGVDDRFTTVECELAAAGKPRATATVRAVRVPDTWREERRERP